MTESSVPRTDSTQTMATPARQVRMVPSRAPQSGDRILAVGLSLAACVGLVGVVGWRTVSDAQQAQADALAMVPQDMTAAVAAVSTSGLTQAQLDAYAAALAEEKARLDAYRAQLVAAAAQLSASNAGSARALRAVVPQAPDVLQSSSAAGSVNTSSRPNTVGSAGAAAAPAPAAAPAAAAPPPVTRTQGS